jgi:hypothetical protein
MRLLQQQRRHHETPRRVSGPGGTGVFLAEEWGKRRGLDPGVPRRFWLVREVDVSGVSGTGIVAEGAQYSDGSVAVHWPGAYPSTTTWNSIEHVLAIHGHGGKTDVHWLDTDRILERCIP